MTAPAAVHGILATLLVLVLTASAPRNASAQDDAIGSFGLSYESANPQVRALDRAERKIRRGRITMITSSLAIGGGVGLLGLSLSLRAWCESCAHTRGENAALAVGVVATTFGVVGMIVGGVVLADGKRAKQDADRERAQTELLLTTRGGALRVKF